MERNDSVFSSTGAAAHELSDAMGNGLQISCAEQEQLVVTIRGSCREQRGECESGIALRGVCRWQRAHMVTARAAKSVESRHHRPESSRLK